MLSLSDSKIVSRKLKRKVFLINKSKKAIRKRQKANRAKKVSDEIYEYSSRVLKCLKNASFSIPMDENKQKIVMVVPKVFCFSQNPDESILFLRKLYTAVTNSNIREIHFDHRNCCAMGVCASTIMDIILLQGEKWRLSVGHPLEYSGDLLSNGKISHNDEVDRLLKASGILKHLNVYDKHFKDVECLELIKGGDSSSIAESVIEYLQRSLKRHKLTLTQQGRNYFGMLLGEISDNCSQHGGDNAAWFTLGHYYRDTATGIGKCKLVILDFGNTIYEGLKTSATVAMQKKIKSYVRRSWTLFPVKVPEETLYTLFSLQQRVSRFEQKNALRGNGTITFLDAFQKIFRRDDSNLKSILSITSGKCSILFDGTYLLKETVFGKNYTNKTIAFNKDNDLKKAPDKKYVRTLTNGFPGTVISMELYIDENLISNV